MAAQESSVLKLRGDSPKSGSSRSLLYSLSPNPPAASSGKASSPSQGTLSPNLMTSSSSDSRPLGLFRYNSLCNGKSE